jgi:hypothetical protein
MGYHPFLTHGGNKLLSKHSVNFNKQTNKGVNMYINKSTYIPDVNTKNSVWAVIIKCYPKYLSLEGFKHLTKQNDFIISIGIDAESREEAMERVKAFTNINFITTDIIQAVIEVGKKKQNAFSQYPENTSVIN